MVNKIQNGIVWIRTPKCATTTLATHFEDFCKWNNTKVTPPAEHNIMAPTKYMNLGHLFSGHANWDIIKKENRLVIGSIRNPLDRFLSHYKHLYIQEKRYSQYGKDISSFYLENYHNTHFESFFRGMDDYLVKYLGVENNTGWDKNLVLEKYDFFTITEMINQTYEKFKKITGFEIDNKNLKENSTKLNLIITDEFLELFHTRNKNDFELYEFVIKNYNYEV